MVKLKSLKAFTIFLIIVFSYKVYSQNYGNRSFSYLLDDQSAKSLGTGGAVFSSEDSEVGYVFSNPALLRSSHSKQLFFSQSFNSYFHNRGNFAFALTTKNFCIMPYVLYSNYGDFESRDVTGNLTGEFSAIDYVVGSAFSRQLTSEITYGVDLSFLGSHYENYSSYGVKMNAGVHYNHSNKLFSSALILKDLGYQFLDYNANAQRKLPSNLALGISYKLEHAPFRFSLIFNELNRWRNYYTDPTLTENIDLLTGDTIPIKRVTIFEQIGHHLLLQTELFVSKHIFLRSGFSYHRRNELQVTTRPGMSGFSLGIGVKTKKIEFNYGYTVYSQASQRHGISLSFKIPKTSKKFLGSY